VSETINFQHVCDEFLLLAAQNCDGSEHSSVGVHSFCNEHFSQVAEGWRTDIAVKLEKDGLGSSRNNGEDDQEFFINLAGKIHANQIKESRKPKWFFEKVRDIPRSDWIALIAVAIAIFK
jgi:hypothetical protein